MFNFMMPDVADTYKNVHINCYPAGMIKLVSYLVPRKSMFEKQQKVVVFGIQAFIKNFKENADAWFAKPTSEVIADYEKKNLHNTPNPDGGKGENNQKSTAEKIAEKMFSGKKQENNILSHYVGGN